MGMFEVSSAWAALDGFVRQTRKALRDAGRDDLVSYVTILAYTRANALRAEGHEDAQAIDAAIRFTIETYRASFSIDLQH